LKRIDPAVGLRRPAIALSSVDFPAPLEPMIVVRRPRARVKEAPWTACTLS
jgi:hypothetical protein